MFALLAAGVMGLIGIAFLLEVVLDALGKGPHARDYLVVLLVVGVIGGDLACAVKMPQYAPYLLGALGLAVALVLLLGLAGFFRGDLAAGDRRVSDYVSAVAIACIVMIGLFAALTEKAQPVRAADISDENSHPIAVSIMPIVKESAKQGNKASALPNAWQRHTPPPPPKTDQNPAPSTQASQTPDDTQKPKPLADAAPPPQDDAAPPDETDAAPVVDETDAGSVEDAGLAVAAIDDSGAQTDGDTPGVAHGTGNALQEGILNDYKNRVAGFIMARFNVRGKVPFEVLKNLHASANVQVSGRNVTGFSVSPSGNAAFDAEVNATLSGIQSNGVLLPAPPAGFETTALGSGFPVYFSCTDETRCK